MTTTTEIHIPVEPSADRRPSYVVAALDRSQVDRAVLVVANGIARHLGVRLRKLHVGGASSRGLSLDERLDLVERGETDQVSGRPVAVLSALVESPPSPLLVVGAPAEPRGSVHRRGTTIAVARRVHRPLIVVPRGLRSWRGPRRVLVPLDGTSITAFRASQAVVDLGLAAVTTTPAHVFSGDAVPKFWDQPVHEYEAWMKEFRARYVDEALEDGFEVRAGPVPPGTQILDMVTHGGFDLVVAVWSQLAPGTNADVVFRLLADCQVPLLLVPSLRGAVTE